MLALVLGLEGGWRAAQRLPWHREVVKPLNPVVDKSFGGSQGF